MFKIVCENCVSSGKHTLVVMVVVIVIVIVMVMVMVIVIAIVIVIVIVVVIVKMIFTGIIMVERYKHLIPPRLRWSIFSTCTIRPPLLCCPDSQWSSPPIQRCQYGANEGIVWL
jgi:hypothetical protein